jgi:hypothetical protein
LGGGGFVYRNGVLTAVGERNMGFRGESSLNLFMIGELG